MRNLSTLGLKLIGTLAIYWAASALGQLLVGIPLLASEWASLEKTAHQRVLREFGIASGIAECVIASAFAAILLSRTEWIVSKFRMPDGPDSLPVLAPAEVLRVCLIVVGSVALITAIPDISVGLVQSLWVEFPEACFGLEGVENEEWRADISTSRTMFRC